MTKYPVVKLSAPGIYLNITVDDNYALDIVQLYLERVEQKCWERLPPKRRSSDGDE